MNLDSIDRSIGASFASSLGAIWRHKLSFVATAAIVFLPSVYWISRLPPLYEASSLLIAGQPNVSAAEGEPRPPQTSAVTLARIAESRRVIGRAIGALGEEAKKLAPPPQSALSEARAKLLSYLRGGGDATPPATTVAGLGTDPAELQAQDTERMRNLLIATASQDLSVRSEPGTDVLRVTFRNRDPETAAKFVNAVAQAFIDLQIELHSRSGAADFFEKQRKRFEDEVSAASRGLNEFSARTSLYSSDDQRKLLLKRMNDLSVDAAATRGSIMQKTGERLMLADELRKLAPVSRSPYVSSIVDSLAGERTPGRPGDTKVVDDRTNDPPLLLIRVYQDSMTSLFRVNSDLAGVQNLLTEQVAELGRLTTQLKALAANEQQFEERKRVLDYAVLNLDTYSRRMVKEQIDAESNAARLSSVRVLETAEIPLRPSAPNRPLLAAAALVTSVIAGLGVALLRNRSGRIPGQSSGARPLSAGLGLGPGVDGRHALRVAADHPPH